jgi:hypothetical protein
MRALIVFLIVALCAPAAAAREGRWTAPSGAWSIDYASQGWTYANPLPDDLRQYARVLVPVEAPPDDEIRMCSVTEIELARSDPDPARVRATAGRISAADAATMYARRNQTVSGVVARAIDGVSIADVSTSSRSGTPHLHRIFYLPVASRIFFIDIDCLWSPTLDPAKVAEIADVLSTISFQVAPPP